MLQMNSPSNTRSLTIFNLNQVNLNDCHDLIDHNTRGLNDVVDMYFNSTAVKIYF